jgi:hypothetical protein
MVKNESLTLFPSLKLNRAQDFENVNSSVIRLEVFLMLTESKFIMNNYDLILKCFKLCSDFNELNYQTITYAVITYLLGSREELKVTKFTSKPQPQSSK